MKHKLFGHRPSKKYSSESEDEEMHKGPSGMAKDNPPEYEGKEPVHYKNPGFSKHHIRYPQDEPHMKSHVRREEEHQAEDNFHMGVPNQTEHELKRHIKRARMKMDAPDQEDPDDLRGNIVHNVGYEGEEDTSGEEEMGPNDMQEDESKERRKKLIVGVMKRKMGKKSKGHSEEEEEEHPIKRKHPGMRNSY